MPKMQKLQQAFENKIQIILVTKNTALQVEKLKSRLPLLQTIELPMLNNDTVLSKLFLFNTVPTHVWVNKKGVVQFITDGWETTFEKIEKYLKGEAIQMALKEEKKDFDPSVPLWLEGNGRQVNHLKYYSFIMERLIDSRTSIRGPLLDSFNRVKGLFARNQSVIELYQMSYCEGKQEDTFSNPNRVVLEFEGAETYKQPQGSEFYNEWANKNLFCYELVLPMERLNAMYDVMKQDLERFFGLKGIIEKRRVTCLVLERMGKKDKIRSSGKDVYYVKLDPFETKLTIINAPIDKLKKGLEQVYWKRYNILDETGYTNNVNIELNVDLTNLKLLNKSLLKYGLRLTKKERVIDMLVIIKA
jgi:hypothetical protein